MEYRACSMDHGREGLTRMQFSGNLIKQPCFDEMRAQQYGYRAPVSLEVTDMVMERSFWVGVYPGMTEKMIDYMARMMIAGVKG